MQNRQILFNCTSILAFIHCMIVFIIWCILRKLVLNSRMRGKNNCRLYLTKADVTHVTTLDLSRNRDTCCMSQLFVNRIIQMMIQTAISNQSKMKTV